MKILIADSGATRTDWALIHEGKPVYVRTSGLHPAYLDEESAPAELKSAFRDFSPDAIRFYGAGCYSDEAAGPVSRIFTRLFRDTPVEIHDDLTAVAHAFLGDSEGIAGILGTGSASASFRYGRRTLQVFSLGYVIGDEGSAADIGKRVLKSALRRRFSPECLEYIELQAGKLEYRKVMDLLYKSRRPSYYLAGLAENILKGDFPEEIRILLRQSFQSFVEEHLKRYENLTEVPVVLTGGVANACKSELAKILEASSIHQYSIRDGLIVALAERQMKKDAF